VGKNRLVAGLGRRRCKFPLMAAVVATAGLTRFAPRLSCSSMALMHCAWGSTQLHVCELEHGALTSALADFSTRRCSLVFGQLWNTSNVRAALLDLPSLDARCQRSGWQRLQPHSVIPANTCCVQGVVDCCVYVHQSVERWSKTYHDQLRR